MKKLCVLLAVLLLLTLCACRAEEQERDRDQVRNEQVSLSADEAVEAALSVLTIGLEENQEALPSMIGADGTLTVPKNSGLATILGSYSAYEVQEISTDGETGTALIAVTAPDAVALLKQIMEKNDDPASEEFAQLLTEALEDEPAMLDFLVEVQLRQVDGSWGIVPSFELSNALTGGLTAEYQSLYAQLTDKLMEGGGQ